MKTYFQIRDLAWEILRDCKIDKLPVNIVDICNKLEIHIYKTLDINDNSYSFKNNIYFNSNIKDKNIIRYLIAYELGKILILKNKITYVDLNKEAKKFADRILATVGVLNELNITSTMDISLICEVPLKVASRRLRRLNNLQERKMFNISQLEEEVTNNFKKFIKEYKFK